MIPGVVDDHVTGVGDVPGHARVVGHVLPDHREGRGDVVLLQDLEDLRGVDRARPVVDGQRDRHRPVVHVVDRLGRGGAVGRGRGGMRVGMRGRVGVGIGFAVAPVGRPWPGWPGWGERRGLAVRLGRASGRAWRPPDFGWRSRPRRPTPSIRPPLAISITRRDTAGVSDRRWSPGFWVYLRIRREPPFLSRLLRRFGGRCGCIRFLRRSSGDLQAGDRTGCGACCLRLLWGCCV